MNTDSVVIGVTGHRDLRRQDLTALRRQVGRVLGELSVGNGCRPLTLLTGLAEGADQLVAQCALDEGWSVVAVQALPAAEFVQDFNADPSSLEKFERILHQCNRVHIASAPGTRRPDCYAAVGEWICERANALVALWDGDTSAVIRPGGTAWVLQRFMQIHTGTALGSSEMMAKPNRSLIGIRHILVRRAAKSPERDV
jgi:hypothetical protein